MSGPAGRPPGGPGLGAGHGRRMGGFGPPGMMRLPAEKPKDFRGSVRRLAGQLRPEATRIGAVAVLAIVGVAAQVAAPKVLANATNALFEGLIGKILGGFLPAGTSQAQAEQFLRQTGQGQFADMLSGMHVTVGVGVDFTAVGEVLAVMVVIYLLSATFQWAAAFIMAGVSQRTVYRMRSDVDHKLGRLPLKYFDSHPRGDILSRVTNDIDNVATTLQQSLTQILTSVFTLLGVLLMMVTISPLLTVLALLVLPLAGVATMLIARRSQREFAAQWERTGTLTGLVEETHTGHVIVKVFGHRAEAVHAFDEENGSLFRASYRAQFISGVVQPVMNFISNLNYVAIAVIGGIQVASGTMTLGDVQAFIQYSRQFTMPITQVASIMNVLQSTIASAERVFELMDEPEEAPDVAQPRVLEAALGRVVFDDVSFRYEPDTPLIEDLNEVAEPGQHRGDRGADGGRQDDARQPVDALLRDRPRPHHGRRDRHPGADPRQPPPHVRHGPPGHVALRRDDPREHRATAARERPRTQIVAAARAAARRPLRAGAAERLRHRRRRRGRQPLAGRAPAPHDRPRLPGRPADPHPRRGDELGRHAHGGPRPAGDEAPDGRPDELRDRPSALDGARRRR